MPPNQKRQGRSGEKLFSAMCEDLEASIEAVVNKPSDDEHGWDYIVELTPPRNDHLPSDLQSHVIRCFAQVKTTAGKYRRTKVKLSNALKFAQSPEPSFIFLLSYYGAQSTPTLYGKMIWEDDIYSALKKAREVSIDMRRQPHEIETPVSFLESDLITDKISDWMFQKISEIGLLEYHKKKTQIIKEVGYESGHQEGHFTIPPEVSIDDLIMHQLGFSDAINVTDFKVYDKRFDLRATYPITSAQSAKLTIKAPQKPVVIRITSNDGKEIEINASLLHPIMGAPSSDAYKFKVSAETFDIVISPNTKTHSIKYNFDLDKKWALSQKVGLLCILAWQSEGDVLLEIEGDVGHLFSSTIPKSPKIEKWILEHATVGYHVFQIMGPDAVRTTNMSHRDFHGVVRDMYLAAISLTSGAIKIETDNPDPFPDFYYLKGFSATRIGPWSVGALYQMTYGARESKAGRQIIYLHSPSILKKLCRKMNSDNFQEIIKDELKKHNERETRPILTLMHGDFRELHRAVTGDGVIIIENDAGVSE